jgi:hypothetical protein
LYALLMGMLLIGACENDINKIKELSAKESEKPLQKTEDVDVLYSDSARVRLRLQTPLLIEYNDTAKNAKEYRTTPRGIKITFYDTLRRVEAGNIVADSSIQYPREKIMEFHRNVVAKSADGEKTFKSEVLIWDQKKKIIYSNQPVQVIMQGSDLVHNGANFTSDEKLTNPVFGASTGAYNVAETP